VDGAPVRAVNAATALRFWDAVERLGDVTDLLHEEIEVHDFDLPDAGVYHGVEGFTRWLGDWGAAWEEWGGSVHDLLDLGDQVVSLTHLHASTGGGLRVERDDSQLLTMRAGRIARLEYFGRPRVALERADDPERAATRKLVHDRIRALYAAAVREDVEAVVAELAPDYEFLPEAGAPMGLAYRGHDGARRYFSEAFEAWEVLDLRVERLVDAGDSVVALFEMRNRGRGSGIELTGRWAEVWETSGRNLTASRFYASHDQAIADAGLA